ncbi:acetyl-CoA carboxylase biotin carboxyl carrier protein subunit, partial [Streptomyces sp. NPDC001816]|uniref:acetyl-CoA carboxylase biotin carboxyl carrier protein subunit n=1 Tax=Streptomyces sp. NPDC001816 TaxID=3364612 RepID=UPI00367467AD
RLVPCMVVGSFALAAYQGFLAEIAASIDVFRARLGVGFRAERDAWEAAGEFARAEAAAEVAPPATEVEVPVGGHLVEAEFTASVWKVEVAVGDRVSAGQPLLALEAMKMESRVPAPADGIVARILAKPGSQVEAGAALVVLAPVETMEAAA